MSDMQPDLERVGQCNPITDLEEEQEPAESVWTLAQVAASVSVFCDQSGASQTAVSACGGRLPKLNSPDLTWG